MWKTNRGKANCFSRKSIQVDKRLDKKYTKEWFILLGLLLGVTVTNGFARFAYGLLLPAMQTQMDWNYAQAGWLSTVNALGYILGAISTLFLVQKFPSEKLFAFGLITTSVVLFMTGVLPALEAQYALRFLAGTFGAVSFSTAGALASGLFKENARLNALSIAILFGTGGGLGIILSGAFIPTLIDVVGNGAWPMCWMIIGLFSMVFMPFGIWSALQVESSKPSRLTRSDFPLLKMLPELAGYACFGFGYIVYLTFLSAWMTAQSISATMITAIWVSGSTFVPILSYFDIICCHFWLFSVHGTRGYNKFYKEKPAPGNVGLFHQYFHGSIRNFPNSWPLRCWINRGPLWHYRNGFGHGVYRFALGCAGCAFSKRAERTFITRKLRSPLQTQTI